MGLFIDQAIFLKIKSMKKASHLLCSHPPYLLNLIMCAILTQGVLIEKSYAEGEATQEKKEILVADAQVADAEVAVQFNASFLGVGADQAVTDLSTFAYGDHVTPGVYLADVYVNAVSVESLEIRFDAAPGDKRGALPCLTRAMLDRWGVNLSKVENPAFEQDSSCIQLSKIIPGSNVNFDVGQMRLNINVPQVFMNRVARGYVSPEQWDAGINAGFVNYRLSSTRNEVKNGATSNSFSGSLQGGINLGEWRLRHRSNYSRANGVGRWQALESYARRDIKAWRSRLTLGDSYTSGNVFADSLSVRGIQLASDESMLPDSQRGFAPTIRGVAETAANVKIEQNGYQIYTIDIPPGPFIIDDLFPTGTSGDLTVTITEADGRKKVSIYPYSALPVQVREGFWKYAVAAGKYRNVYGAKEPIVAQGDVAYGLNSSTTVYGGLRVADIYQSSVMGVGVNLGNFGSIKTDATFARSKDPQGNIQQGQSLGFLYTKMNLPTETTFTIAGYRYSTQKFRSFYETVNLYSNNNWQYQGKRRHRVEGNIGQRLVPGTVSANLLLDKYWDGSSNRSSRVSYNSTFRRLNYSIDYQYNVNKNADGTTGQPSRLLSASLNIPLEWSAGVTNRTTYVNYSASSNLEGSVSQNVGVSGLLLENNSVSYSANVGNSNVNGTTGSATLTYDSPYATLSATRSQSRNYNTTIFSMGGGIVGHAGGITLSQNLGETMVLVNVPGAKGVEISNNPGVKTDFNGYALVPYATPYRENSIALNTETLSENVEVKNAALKVVPTSGAIVLARYEARKGYKVLMVLSDRDGKYLPLGVRVEDGRGKEAGIVGANGLAYITGADAKGELTVKWRASSVDKSCRASYMLPVQKLESDKKTSSGLLTAKAVCI